MSNTGGMEYIRKMYNVPAKRGGRIRSQGCDTGTIVAAKNGLLRVRFDGQKRIARLHPTWRVEYMSALRTADGMRSTGI